MEILKDKKIYFSSDNHLGSPTLEDSKEREGILTKFKNGFSRMFGKKNRGKESK